MKRFLLQFGTISLVFLIICTVLSSLTYSERFIMYKTLDTPYKKVAWNLNVIEKHPERLKNSTVFLGSSLVQGAIQDSLLQAKNIAAVNMAVPHNGNDLNLYFFERILPLNPEKVVWLKGKVPYTGLHKLTPLLYKPGTLLSKGQGLNSSFIHYFFKRVKLSMEFIGFQLFQGEWKPTSSEQTFLNRPYGYIIAPGALEQEVFVSYQQKGNARTDEYFNLYLNDFKYQKELGADGIGHTVQNWKRKLVHKGYLKSNFLRNVGAQEAFVSQAVDQGLENQIELTKLYVPLLVDAFDYSQASYRRSFYQKTTTDEQVPVNSLNAFTFLGQADLWSDEDHVNEEGAFLFTNALIQACIFE